MNNSFVGRQYNAKMTKTNLKGTENGLIFPELLANYFRGRKLIGKKGIIFKILLGQINFSF